MASPGAAGLERIDLGYKREHTAIASEPLASARFERLSDLRLGSSETAAGIRRVFATEWFGRLRRLKIGPTTKADEIVIADQLVLMPDLADLTWSTHNVFVVRFRLSRAMSALGRLVLRSPDELSSADARTLANTQYPRLRSLCAEPADWSAFDAITGADWFSGLRDWSALTSFVDRQGIGVRELRRLAAVGSRHLRALRLDGPNCAVDVLNLLADSTPLPDLRSLTLSSPSRLHPVDAARFFAALRLPQLRSLDLFEFPLDDAGVTAIAANPTFAGLTRLTLTLDPLPSTTALRTLFESPVGQNLAYFSAWRETGVLAATVLTDPAVMPNVGRVELLDSVGGAGLPPSVFDALRAARGEHFAQCQ